MTKSYNTNNFYITNNVSSIIKLYDKIIKNKIGCDINAIRI